MHAFAFMGYLVLLNTFRTTLSAALDCLFFFMYVVNIKERSQFFALLYYCHLLLEKIMNFKKPSFVKPLLK